MNLAVGILAAWAAAILEGLLLEFFGSGRGVADWVHALLLYGWFGGGLALGISLLVWPLERVRPGLTEIILLPGVLFCLAVAIGGMWLNLSPALPPFTTTAGGVINATFLLLCIANAAAMVRWRWKRWASTPPARWTPVAGALLLIVLLVVSGVRIMPSVMRSSPDIPASSPPVIVLMIDTLRRDHLGCYGYSRDTSPHIDALAQDAIVFDSSTTSGNFTVPSIASLFTGLYPSQHGMIAVNDELPVALHTLAEAFHLAGYRTGAVVGNPILRPESGFARGFDFFEPKPVPGWIQQRTTALERAFARIWGGDEPGVVQDLVPSALQWLNEPSPRPPFLYLHLLEPHSPYAPPLEHVSRFLESEDSIRVMDPPNIWKYRSLEKWENFEEFDSPPVVDDAKRRNMVGLYDGEIRYVDTWIGSFLDALREEGVYDEAVIVLLSDHGEEFDDHGGWFHGLTVYQEMVAMPLIIKLPHHRSAGSRSDLPVDMVDLAATVSSLAGLDPVWNGPGEDYSATIHRLSQSASARAPSVSFVERPPFLYGFRSGNWKLIRRVRDDVQTDRLFDLATDPGETTDLGTAYPDSLLSLQSRLGALLDLFGEMERVGNTGEIDPETLRALRTLGYTN